MEKDIKVVENEDGSLQTEIKIPNVVPFDPEQMNIDAIFNFEEMRKTLDYKNDTFTVHPYPKNDFSPIGVLETLELWGITPSYHCERLNDPECIGDIYQKALIKIDQVFKKRLGRKWGLYLMPDGYNLAVIHNRDILVKEYNNLINKEQKKENSKRKAIESRSKISSNALKVLSEKKK